VTDFAQRYRGMSNPQLVQLVADPNALVPEARDALHAEIARRPAPAPQTAFESTHVEQPASAKGSLDGVGGWLAWYCLGLFGGVYNELRMITELRGGVERVMFAFTILCLFIAAWNLVTAISIVRRARYALWMIFIQITVGGMQGAFIFADGAVLRTSSPGLAEAAMMLMAVGIGVCAGHGVWFRYFQVSKRVQITFGRNL
jgi:hypothetical protein